MKKFTYLQPICEILLDGENFICQQFFDVDSNMDGVDISTIEDGKLTYIGEIFGVVLPDIDTNDEERQSFEILIEEWLEENFW